MLKNLKMGALAGIVSDQNFSDIEFSGARLSRALGRVSTVSNCEFTNCTFPEGVFFNNVRFDSCNFENCNFGGRQDPIFFANLNVVNCNFSNCNLFLDDAGDGNKKSVFVNSKISGGKIGRFFFLGADFSETIVRTELRGFVLHDCFGSHLSLIGSEGIDACIHDVEAFEEVKLPEDSATFLWRNSKVLYSYDVLQKVLSLVDDPESWRRAGEQRLEDHSVEFISYSVNLLSEILNLHSEASREVFEVIRCQA